MDAIVFLLILAAGVMAISRRGTGVILAAYAVAFVVAVLLFLHHVTDPLAVSL